jgi:hypothetical protein
LEEADCIKGPFARSGQWTSGRAVTGSEWLVERCQLADALHERARLAGAERHVATVIAAVRLADGWQVRLRGRGAQRRGPLLLAVGQHFRRRRPAAPGTHIAVTDAGWCWWAEHEDSLWVQMIGCARSTHPDAWIGAAAAQIPDLARALVDASADAPRVARAAHAQFGAVGHDPTRWRVGDAAYALDPLSGQGVYEALRGARLVSTAIHSILDGGDARLAHRFVSERHEQAWQDGVRVAGEFYRA